MRRVRTPDWMVSDMPTMTVAHPGPVAILPLWAFSCICSKCRDGFL